MQELLEKLGINWQLLAAQAANFLLVLILLRLTVYKPLVNLLSQRRAKIEQGMRDAEEAGKHLANVEEIGKQKLAETDRQSLQMIAAAQERAKGQEAQLLAAAKTKETEALAAVVKLAEAKKREAEEAAYRHAQELVSEMVGRVVHGAPVPVDDALVAQAVAVLKGEHRE